MSLAWLTDMTCIRRADWVSHHFVDWDPIKAKAGDFLATDARTDDLNGFRIPLAILKKACFVNW
jgi:hypothetical protein